jgi:hypothetical protein
MPWKVISLVPQTIIHPKRDRFGKPTGQIDEIKPAGTVIIETRSYERALKHAAKMRKHHKCPCRIEWKDKEADNVEDQGSGRRAEGVD